MAIDVSLAPRRIARPVVASSGHTSGTAITAGLMALTACAGAATVARPDAASFALFLPIVVAAGLLLPQRRMLAVFAAVGVAYVIGLSEARPDGAAPVALILIATMALIAGVERRRTRSGVSPAVGSSMLLDLRERLQAQGRLPVLPCGWNTESSVQPAYGDSFSGDFVVGNCPAPDRLELALVDVSGKGCTAGTRSLLLGGAFAGLLGAMEPTRFLPAANDYLVRQGWSEGFATAVHASIDLTTGEYTIGSAGHPPAMHYCARRGTFSPVAGASGVLLGVLEAQGPQDFVRAHGRLEPGDALLLVSDGVFEEPGVDLFQGMDRMRGRADQVLSDQGAGGAAARICSLGSGGENDDRAAVLVWRE